MMGPLFLIIDDDKQIIKIISRLLSDMGEVIFAENGNEGIELARSRKPDLVLLDMVMPNVDGLDVIKHLSCFEETKCIPIISITAHGDLNIEAEALNAGAVDFVHKPINPVVFVARVKLHLRLRDRELELKRLYEQLNHKNKELEYASTHDELTGLYNRVLLREFLRVNLAQAERNCGQNCLAMLDIDFFKKINDKHGHQVGDTVLVGVAGFLTAHIRKSDIIFRYGGEEFLMILQNVNLQQAELFLEDLRHYIVNSEIAGLEAGSVAVSIGVTLISHQDKHPDVVISRADQALYLSKSSGRNRVSVVI